MSGRAGQPSALRFVIFNQLHDLGLKSILRAVNGSDRLGERLLLELFFNRQAEFSEFFDIRSRMKLQVLKIGKNGDAIFPICLNLVLAQAFRASGFGAVVCSVAADFVSSICAFLPGWGARVV